MATHTINQNLRADSSGTNPNTNIFDLRNLISKRVLPSAEACNYRPAQTEARLLRPNHEPADREELYLLDSTNLEDEYNHALMSGALDYLKYASSPETARDVAQTLEDYCSNVPVTRSEMETALLVLVKTLHTSGRKMMPRTFTILLDLYMEVSQTWPTCLSAQSLEA
nr:MAG: hypothetical protein [Crogonang virus 150]